MAFNRNALRNMGQAAQQSASRAEEGSGFKNYIKTGCPRPQWKKIAEGPHIMDIIPFMPTADFANCKKDVGTYLLEVYAHGNVGPTNSSIICPAQTLGKPCPICEDLQAKRDAGVDYETLKSKFAKRRVVYNVWRHDPTREQENKGVQILEISHWTMEKKLLAIAQDPMTGEWVPFADPDQGRAVCFRRTGTKVNNTVYDGFQWGNRPAPIPDALLEQALPLNEWVDVLSYQEIADMYFVEQQPETEGAPATGGYAGYGAPAAAAPAAGGYGGYGAPAAAPATPANNDAQAYGAPAGFYDTGTTPPPAQTYGAPTSPENITTTGQELPWGTNDLPPTQAPVQQAPVQQATAAAVAQAPVQQAPVQQAPIQQAAAAAVQKKTLTTAPAAAATNRCPMAEYGGVFGVTLDAEAIKKSCVTCELWDDCAATLDASKANG